MENVILTTFSKEELQALINEAIERANSRSKDQTNVKEEKEDKLLTRNETAALLKITLVTLSDWSKRGIIQSYYLGGRVYYKEKEIIASLYKAKEGRGYAS